MPVSPSGSGCSSSPAAHEAPRCSGLRPISSSPRPSSSQRPTPRSLRDRKLSGAASTTKPSTRSVRIFPPRTSSFSRRTVSASGASASSRRAAASPRDPAPDHDDPHATSDPSDQGAARSRTSSANVAMKTRILVQRGWSLEPHAEPRGDRRRLVIDVEEDLDVVGDEPDRHRDDVSNPLRRQRLQVLAEIGARPTARVSGPQTGTPRTSGRRRHRPASRRAVPSRDTGRRTDRRPRARAPAGCAR